MFYRAAGVLMLIGGIYGYFWAARWSDDTLREQRHNGQWLARRIARLPPEQSRRVFRDCFLFMAVIGALAISMGDG